VAGGLVGQYHGIRCEPSLQGIGGAEIDTDRTPV
jgi:hypothetical protein